MATLTVWRYETVNGASDAAELLKKLARKDALVLHDAAIVEWDAAHGRPRTRQLSPSTPATGALGGGFWGLLFGLIFFMPLLGAAIGAATGALAGALTDVGIDDGFINRVRDSVTPGTSALFVLTSGATLERIHDALAGGPQGALIFTNLSEDLSADRLTEAGLLALHSIPHVAISAAFPALLAAVFAETRQLGSWLYYAFIGLAIAGGGFLLLYLTEPPTRPYSVFQAYFLIALLTAGLVGGLVYWSLSGRYAAPKPAPKPA